MRKGKGADPRLDNAVQFITRKGGLDGRETTLQAELIHAAGGRKYLPVGLLRKAGQGLTWSKAAAYLADSMYSVLDEHGRPDEAKARELLVNTVRKWTDGLSNLHYTITGPRRVGRRK